jgi:Cu(I)/Ag(I) efflux system membrane protein CusA/SilA
VDRNAAARFGLNVADVLEIADVAVGGRVITETIEGRERYPITLRYPQDRRDSLDRLRQLPIVTASGAQITLGDVATVSVQDGPAAIRSEDGQLYQPIYVVPSIGDVAAFAREAERRIDAAGILPAGYSLRWSGQYEYMQRAFGRLELILPLVLAIMLIMLYASSKRVSSMLLVLVSLPVALLGGAWLQYFLGYHMSVAVAVGYLALGGVAVETGVVMLLYLNTAWDARRAAHARPSRGELLEAVTEGALLRLRPKLMTVITIMAALLPILVGGGTGSELTKRVAAPMVGGIVTALFLTLLVIPAAFLLINERRCESRGTAA